MSRGFCFPFGVGYRFNLNLYASCLYTILILTFRTAGVQRVTSRSIIVMVFVIGALVTSMSSQALPRSWMLWKFITVLLLLGVRFLMMSKSSGEYVRLQWNRTNHRSMVLHESLLKVNSGHRCKKLNDLVRGSANSQHMKGQAADIASDAPIHLAWLVIERGFEFDQMILYPNFIHLSYTLERPNRKKILYNANYHGPKL